MSDIINRASARLLLKNVVVPAARLRFRKALTTEGAGDVVELGKRVSREVLQAHADEFPAIDREHGARLVDLYAELCEEAFSEEYAAFVRPKDDGEDSVN